MHLNLYCITTPESPHAFVAAKTPELAVAIYVSAEADHDRELGDFTIERWDPHVAPHELMNLPELLSGWEAGMVTCDPLKGGWSLMRPD